MLIYM